MGKTSLHIYYDEKYELYYVTNGFYKSSGFSNREEAEKWLNEIKHYNYIYY